MNARSVWIWWQQVRAIAARHGRRGPGAASDAPDDLAQDMALAALEQAAPADRPGAWLERVGRNAAIDGWRAERRRGELAGALQPPAGPPDPEAALMARERRAVVRRALLALPRPQRRAALLRFHCGLPFDDVAARLGTEPATARSRVHRALVSLRAQVRGLRALAPGWGWHGAQATALGLALVAATGTAAEAPIVLVTAEADVAPARPSRSWRSTRAPTPAPRMPAPVRQAQPARGTAETAETAEPPAVQIMVFGADLVEGNTTGPDGEYLELLTPEPQPSLIEIRGNFLPEMVKSLEEL